MLQFKIKIRSFSYNYFNNLISYLKQNRIVDFLNNIQIKKKYDLLVFSQIVAEPLLYNSVIRTPNIKNRQ